VDVAAWLRALGLEQYELAFRENAIDVEVLPDLSETDLDRLGVAPVGHRKKLLRAIAALQVGAAPPPGAAAPPELPLLRREGERRQVTVLFADLVAYTVLSRELDPEEVHALLCRFFECMDRAVEDHGGRVERHIGDCVMAVFGAPVAHGNDAERAVRAAVAIVNVMPELSAEVGHPVRVHVGMASGQVVASATGSITHSEYAVIGESVNLASRLANAAQPGEILLSEAVRLALHERLECVEAGALSVKGFAEPVGAWRLLGLRTTNLQPRPFIGRKAELQQLRAALATCRATGRGQTIYVRGEPGIGKTRLVEEFQRAAAGAGFACHSGVVLDFGTGAGPDAIHALVRGLLDLTSDTDAASAAAAAALADNFIVAEDAVFLNDLLDLPQPMELRIAYDAMDNETRIYGKRRAVVRLVERASRLRPRLFLVEDLQWADDLTLMYLADLTTAAAQCPAVLVMTSRTDGDPLDRAWRERAAGPLISLDLGPLGRMEARAMVKGFLNANASYADRCVERAAGNPLFLEQLLRHAEESAKAADVPGSVQSLVQARMDRLDPADKEALQAASIFGQRFSLDGLRHLLGSPTYDCNALMAHALVRPQGEEFLFAHALIRDAVYATLLKRRRRSLHRQAAEWFAGRDPILYAEHLDRAESPEAPQAYLAAARTQAALYSYERALALVERGLVFLRDPASTFMLKCYRGEILRDLGRTREARVALEAALAAAQDDRERYQAWLELAGVKRMTDDLPGAFADLEKAEAIAVRLGLISEKARLHFLRGNLLFARGDIEGCLCEHQQTLKLARQAGSAELQAFALSGLGDAECLRGRFCSAHDWFRRCIELSRRHGFGRIEVANRPMLAIMRWYAGDTPGALHDALAAIEAAAKAGHRRAEIIAHHAAYFCLHSMTDLTTARKHIETALTLARQIGARQFEAQSLAFRGNLHRLLGRRRQALADLEGAVAMCREIGMAFTGPCVLGMLALAAEDPQVRDGALREGEALLAAGAVGHNHLMFRKDAIEVCLCAGAWDDTDHHAAALASFIRSEPLPWVEFVVARGRALAAHGRGRRDPALIAELGRLRDEGVRLRRCGTQLDRGRVVT
jgi:class 3 adenylate cyclase/tetratricopeptide (TPR) repeat protein